MQMLPNPGNGGNDPRQLITVMLIFMVTAIGYHFYQASYSTATPEMTAAQVEAEAAVEDVSLVPEKIEALPPKLDVAPVDVTARQSAQNTAGRISFANTRYDAGVSVQGGRLNYLAMPALQDDIHSEGKAWFTANAERFQYLDTGWLGTGVLTPNKDAVWQPSGQLDDEVRLVWANTHGQVFERVFTLSKDQYMVTVTDRVTNQAEVPVTLQHYAQVVRKGKQYEGEQSTWMSHFGPIGLMEGVLVEASYDDVAEANVMQEGRGGWWGISSKYFITAIGAPQDVETVRRFNHTGHKGADIFTAVVQHKPLMVGPQETREIVTDVYVGPKSVAALAGAGYALNRAVDYGWFSALAKPMYHILLWFHGWLGNWGLAIIALTIVLKIITLPLTYRSFAAMAKLKKLQPEMKAMQEKYKDNREQMATAMMALYKEYKVSPLSGCWPMLVQMPIFFAMYKVMLISFEFRGAPFYGWITDLSLQDPYYVLPLLMGASMWVQMQLNPQAGDPVQQQVMKVLPIVFTFFFLFFPSGLVLYWLTNNLISIAQQWWMLKREGVR